MIEIPLKAKNDEEFTTLRKNEREIIVYAVLCGVDNQTAFLRYNPHYAVSVGKTSPKFALSDLGKRECKNFWTYPKVRAYRESYEQTLAEYLGRRGRSEVRVMSDEPSEDRKDRALKSLLNQAMSLVEGSGDLDAETLKIAAEIFKKVGLLKEEEEEQEKPRRYLPERCSACLYKSFVESHVETGEIENACLRCKALKIAKEQGFRYDERDILERK